MSAKTVPFRFPIILCFLGVFFVSWPRETVGNEFSKDAINMRLLEEVRLPELAELIVVTDAEEMNGMDQLILLRGKTSLQDAEAITRLLQARNFENQDEDGSFLTGTADGWWTIDGAVTATKTFKRVFTGEETIVKLISTSNGEQWLLLEQVGF